MYEMLDTPLHSYPVIGICVQMYRRPLYYVLNVMMPTVLLNVLVSPGVSLTGRIWRETVTRCHCDAGVYYGAADYI